MTSRGTKVYLRDAVMTASPVQLQLMLYDGAVRFATQGKDAILAKRHEEAFESLSRAQKIILEMDRGLNHEVAPELCQRMSALYMFMYRKLVEACVQHDPQAIDDALSILKHERETWIMLMDKLAREAAPGAGEPPTPGAGGSLSVSG